MRQTILLLLLSLAGCGASTAVRCIVTAQCPAGESCDADSHECASCGVPSSQCASAQVCWHDNCLDPCEVPGKCQ